jgi:hypothetical protein
MRPTGIDGGGLRPSPGQSLIVLFRERSACRVPLDVADDNVTWLTAVDGGSYVTVSTSPGPHSFYVFAAQRGVRYVGAALLKGTLKADQAYYVALDGHDPGMAVQDEGRGRYEFDIRAVRQSSHNVENAVARAQSENEKDPALARAHTLGD